MQRFLVIVGLLFLCSIAFAQTTIPKHIDVNPKTQKKPISIQAKTLAEAAAEEENPVDSVINFIVRLKTSPGARTAAARQSLSATIDREHSDFLSGIYSLNSNLRTSPETQTISVVLEFRKSINGFTIKANRSLAGALMKMPHVISVNEDKKVQINDETSNQYINVPQAWNELGAKGDGIVIGIIDTGIDYKHPDLGNGIGPTKKVIGGYDFINNDADPMDDHGHGTHCAGISAANGTIKGVAPNAKLMAIKVLNNYGSGSDSQVLAGIEYAMDPDGNPNTDDAPDVVNMSLGRTPDPNEPMSEAVNNAVLSGIVFCVAAGNDYGYMKIGTPGIAEQAITVAATDAYDNIASFSSKGPTIGSFILKPDVSGPGVDIYSTYFNQSYATMSGTSMATPHITGVAALIRGKHPDWTPADVKAALMSTTKPSETKYLEKGAGVVDAYKAIKQEIIMSPASISYGKIDNTPGTFSKQDVITVTNKGTSAQQINLAVNGTTSASIDVSISSSSFQLQPGASKEVTVSISVNRSSLEKTTVGQGHFATVDLTSGDKKSSTILSLFNPTLTTFEFPGELPNSIFIMGMNTSYWEPFYPTSPSLDVILPPGKYDAVTWFSASIVFTEDFEITAEPTSILVDSKDARNTITMRPLDQNGIPIPLDLQNLSASTTMTGPNISSAWFFPQFTFQISNTKKYKIYNNYFYVKPNSDKAIEIALTTGEVSASKTVSNDPADFIPVKYTNPSIDEGQYQMLKYFASTGAFTMWGAPLKVSNPTNFLVSIIPGQYNSSFYRFSPIGDASGYTWETAMRKITPENGLQFVDFTYSPLKTVGAGPYDFHLGESLLNFTGYPYIRDDLFTIMMYNYLGVYNYSYFEHMAGTVNWSLTNDGQPVSTGNFLNHTMEDVGPWEVFSQKMELSGTYKLTMNWDNNYVAGRFGEAKTEMTFTKDFPFVQGIRKYELTQNGKVTNKLEGGERAEVEYQIGWGGLNSKLEIKELYAEDWTTLSTIIGDDGTSQKVTIPDNLQPGHYSLRLTGDYFGAKVVHTLEPAFAVGEQEVTIPFTKVTLLSPLNYDINTGVNPVFTWSSVPNATYLFQISKSPAFTDLLTSRNVEDEEFQLTFQLTADETYYWRVRANIAGVDLPWSNTFSFSASTLTQATLVAPANDAIGISPESVKLTWTPGSASAAAWQILEVSPDPTFNGWDVYQTLPPSQSEYQAFGLRNGMKFYWRITTSFFPPHWLNALNLVSDVYSFETEPGFNEITGLENELGMSQAFPNPFSDRAYIKVYSQMESRAQVKLVDQLGRPVRTTEHSLAKGENTLIIEGENVQQGLYVAVIELASGEKYRLKIVRK